MQKITSKKVRELVETGESSTLEFKESFSGSLGKEICAFANAGGGIILLGVSDTKEICGFTPTNSSLSQIQDIARNIDPPLQLRIEHTAPVTIIHVPEGKEKPYFVHGHCYMRQGPNTQQLKRDEIRKLFQTENLLSFDRKANQMFKFSDFDQEAFAHFVVLATIDRNLPQNHILKNLGLLTENILNNTGVIFFAKDVSKYFLNASISCVLYEGTTKTKILDIQELRNHFTANLHAAVKFVLRNLRTEYIIERITREERPEIPENILRELIINAMVHRDYFSEGRILIEIFGNRIEISNPGGLLFNAKEFGKRSLARNPLLTDMVHRIGIVEKIGSGICRVQNTLKNQVAFELNPDWFRVIITRKNPLYAPVSAAVNAPAIMTSLQQMILTQIQINNRITYDELSDVLSIHRTTIMRNISKLKAIGILQRIGSDKTGHWEIITNHGN